MWSVVLNLLGWLCAIVLGGSILAVTVGIIVLIWSATEAIPVIKQAIEEELNNECSSSKENREED